MPSTSTQPGDPDRDDPASLHALLAVDAEARRALAAAYRGPHDVLDALWWREHPLTPTPGGRPDPATARAALQRRAYAPGPAAALVEVVDAESGDTVRVPAAAAELFALEARLRADAGALDTAIQDARPTLEAAAARRAAELRQDVAASPSETAGARTGPDAAGPATARPAAGRPDDDRAAARTDHAAHLATARPVTAHPAAAHPNTPTLETWRKRSLIWMWTSVAAGLLLLTGVGIAVGQQLNPAANVFGRSAGSAGQSDGGGDAGADATSTPSPTSAGLPPGLTIFEDPTLAPNIPPQNIDPYYKPESLRLLGVADSELTVYAVENRIDQPCLLAVYVDGTQSATCVTKEEFAVMGIELRITSLRTTQPGQAAPEPAEDVVFWNADGSYGVSSSPSRTS